MPATGEQLKHNERDERPSKISRNQPSFCRTPGQQRKIHYLHHPTYNLCHSLLPVRLLRRMLTLAAGNGRRWVVNLHYRLNGCVGDNTQPQNQCNATLRTGNTATGQHARNEARHCAQNCSLSSHRLQIKVYQRYSHDSRLISTEFKFCLSPPTGHIDRYQPDIGRVSRETLTISLSHDWRMHIA